MNCGQLDEELLRLFDLHLDRFGQWLFYNVQAGISNLALKIADSEKKTGESADLESVKSLFWWSGDLRFLQRLRSRNLLHAAFDAIADITDYDNTTRVLWTRREKGGSRVVREVHSFNNVWSPEAQDSGSSHRTTHSSWAWALTTTVAAVGTSFCDELGGWEAECKGSNRMVCEVYIAHKTTCNEYCTSQHAWCEAAFDDEHGDRCRRQEYSGSSCNRTRTQQICRCRRRCEDSGPWLCQEEGCPARVVTCDILKAACKAAFRDIWRKAPLGMGPVLVEQACPAACGRCASGASAMVSPSHQFTPSHQHTSV